MSVQTNVSRSKDSPRELAPGASDPRITACTLGGGGLGVGGFKGV